MVQTAAITKIPLDTLNTWKKKDWWKEQVQAFYDDDKQELDAKYQKIVRKALAVIDDRLENGNFQYDQKTGRVTRVPVNMADTHRVMKDLVDQQQVLRKEKVNQEVQQIESANERLAKLAMQFAEMTMGKKTEKVVPGEIYDMEALQEIHLKSPQDDTKTSI
jgi:hypothetical protein